MRLAHIAAGLPLSILGALIITVGTSSVAKHPDLHQECGSNIFGQSILAFGDSLTHGLFIGTGSHRGTHPYSLRLGELLREHCHANITESGISGETAVQMKHRLPTVLESMMPTVPRVVIILAGTNDFAYTSDYKKVLASVVKLHEIVFAHAAYTGRAISTVAVGIPQVKAQVLSSYHREREKTRQSFNNNLSKYADAFQQYMKAHLNMSTEQADHPTPAAGTSVSDMRMIYVNYDNIFDQQQSSNSKYWSSDMLHYSPLGYDRLGELLFDALDGM